MFSFSEISGEPSCARTLKRYVYTIALLGAFGLFCLCHQAGASDCPTAVLPNFPINVPVNSNNFNGMSMVDISHVRNSAHIQWWSGMLLDTIHYPDFKIYANPSDQVEVCLKRNDRVLRSEGCCTYVTDTTRSTSMGKVFYPLLNRTNANMTGLYSLVAFTNCSRSLGGRVVAHSKDSFRLTVYDNAAISKFQKRFHYQADVKQDGLLSCCARFTNTQPEMKIIVTGLTSNESFTARTGPNEVCHYRVVLASDIEKGQLSNATCVATTNIKWLSSSKYFDQRVGRPSCTREDKRTASISIEKPTATSACKNVIPPSTPKPFISGGTHADSPLPVTACLLLLLIALASL